VPLRVPAPAAYAASAALHAAAFLGLLRAPALARGAPEEVAVEVIEVAPPPAPPEPPPLVAAAPRRPPRHLSPPRDAPPPPAPAPAPEAPPPPNAPPPEGAPPPAQAPVRIGVSMSSETSAAGVAAPAGNTLYGELPRTAPDPGEVKPYASERYLPPTQLTVLPRPLDACYETSADDYPEEGRRVEAEGLVRLQLTVDEKGTIVDARVIEEPGHGLGGAAVAALKRHGCRFEPGRRGTETYGTRVIFKYRFQLP
jgi:protein TonB